MKRLYCSNACRQRAYRQRVRPESNEEARPVHVLDVAPWSALDTFVGRQGELASLHRLFRQHRLITLFGPGGAGKTRMATEFATSARPVFPDGIHLVEFARITRPELVGQAVAQAMGVAERPDATIEDTLVDALRDKDVLLVLDNCEHLVDACSELADALLHRCPHARILATSRETLRIPGEKVFSLGALTVDDAVRLFADRARSAAPAFELTGDDHDVVRSICQRLDNLPLAVELAARLVRLLPVGYILAQLEDRFHLLTSGARSADTRHQSLYAVIDWSYCLLSDDEQALLRRLSVLPGGFDVDLAVAVSGDLGLPVMQLITSLESKSLLATVPGAEELPRFRQWESVRAYAHERLVERGELPDATEHVIAALAVLAAPLTQQFTPPREVVNRLLTEQDNLLQAIDYLHGRGDGREPLLAAALSRCRAPQGIVANGRELLAAALRVEDAPPAHRVLALDESAWNAAWQGDHERALTFARQSVEASRGVNPLLRCRALTALAFAHQVRGEYPEAIAHFTECLSQIRVVGEPPNVALCSHNLAWVSMLAGDLGTAEAVLTDALPIYRANGDPARLANALHTAGTLRLLHNDIAAAARHFATGLNAIGEEPSVYTPSLVEGIGLTALRGGQTERGLRLIGAAGGLWQAIGTHPDPWWQKQVESAVDEARTRFPGLDVDRVRAEGRRLRDSADILDLALRQRHAGAEPRTEAEPISGRERQVATLVASGSTNHEIARRLRISERTVESHLDHMRTKLNLRSRAHLAAWVARNLPNQDLPTAL